LIVAEENIALGAEGMEAARTFVGAAVEGAQLEEWRVARIGESGTGGGDAAVGFAAEATVAAACGEGCASDEDCE